MHVSNIVEINSSKKKMLPARTIVIRMTRFSIDNMHKIAFYAAPAKYNYYLACANCLISNSITKSIIASRNCNSKAASTQIDSNLDINTYRRICTETLDALCDYFEELIESTNLNGSDVSHSDGVLTVNLGQKYGTYVINRQTPNKQIWLSSPTSGPKRYDFVGASDGAYGKWVYKHNGESLHELLQTEIKSILKTYPVNFMQLPYCC